MYTDNAYAIHLLGFMLIGFCLFEAWQGKLYGSRGQTEFDREPLRFAVGGGLQLAIGILIALDSNWTRSLSYQTSIFFLLLLSLVCTIFLVTAATIASHLRKRMVRVAPDSKTDSQALSLGAPSIGVLALFLFWLVMAALSPTVFADLAHPALSGHYIKCLVGSILFAVLWALIGISFLYPYRVSVSSGTLYLQSLTGITEVPMYRLVSVDRGTFLIKFVTSDKKYIMVNCFTDSPEHKASTREFMDRINALTCRD
ncbi:MAG: hypothetical protein AB7W16_10900 [Candidatus Obscuribacterales bacterium]